MIVPFESKQQHEGGRYESAAEPSSQLPPPSYNDVQLDDFAGRTSGPRGSAPGLYNPHDNGQYGSSTSRNASASSKQEALNQMQMPSPAPDSRVYVVNKVPGNFPLKPPYDRQESSFGDPSKNDLGTPGSEPYAHQDEYIQPAQTGTPRRTQPQATLPMGVDARNVNRVAKNAATGERDWSHGLCGCCCSHCGTCCYASCCPCMVYSKVKTRVSYLERNKYPHPTGGDACTMDCFLHGTLTTLCGLGWILQIGQRTTVRDRYRIEGSSCGDCMAALCCTPCALTQESREVGLEEAALVGPGMQSMP